MKSHYILNIFTFCIYNRFPKFKRDTQIVIMFYIGLLI